MLCAARSLGGLRCVCFCPIRNQTKMDSQTIIVRSASCSRSPPAQRDASASISVGEWQGWGTSSQIPAMVVDVIGDLKLLERDMEAQMSFGGLGGKLQVRLTATPHAPPQHHPNSLLFCLYLSHYQEFDGIWMVLWPGIAKTREDDIWMLYYDCNVGSLLASVLL